MYERFPDLSPLLTSFPLQQLISVGSQPPFSPLRFRVGSRSIFAHPRSFSFSFFPFSRHRFIRNYRTFLCLPLRAHLIVACLPTWTVPGLLSPPKGLTNWDGRGGDGRPFPPFQDANTKTSDHALSSLPCFSSSVDAPLWRRGPFSFSTWLE